MAEVGKVAHPMRVVETETCTDEVKEWRCGGWRRFVGPVEWVAGV